MYIYNQLFTTFYHFSRTFQAFLLTYKNDRDGIAATSQSPREYYSLVEAGIHFLYIIGIHQG